MYRLFVEGPKEFPILIGRRPNKQKAAREAKSLLDQYKKAWVEDEDQRRVYSCWKSGDKVSSKSEGKRLPLILDLEEVSAMIDTFPDTFIGKRNKTALVIAYRCGLRVSEICNLTLDDVDLKSGYVMVKHGKGDADRNIPIDPKTEEYLREWLETRKTKKTRTNWFLITRDGKKVCTRTLRYAFKDASEAAGVYLADGQDKRPVNPHAFRHCFATDMLTEGFNIRQVQKMLGHKNLATTMIYTEVVDPELKEKFQGRKW
jgi:site-specific recombinase XerD